ncbi:aconitate hydratase AcnA [Lichenihabitans sp. Uapishka_5]|uniref:aconitate hydratase AcnA n=1 Tax=Lichenihabitans sp. Uapishka_5 TaxID=3037302 RepID=UPI0029E7DD1A|nr:aconitate hydratase AcnA [Lichenihabitans sp. Uapishka_5]MDX7950982.1 aconitate hydratase AcnA [Lichenihabitans sp. Uapishka_5]
MTSHDSFKSRKTLQVGDKTYTYFSIPEAEKNGLTGVSKLPYSMKVLLENLLRHEDGRSVTKAHIGEFVTWLTSQGRDETEIAFRPARVLMQDFTGVPAVVDLAAMRDAMAKIGGPVEKINPLVPVDLVIDHSVIVDEFGTPKAYDDNVDLEYKRNIERYQFLRWGQSAFDNFRVVPPGTGICHQVNLEYLSQTVWLREEDGFDGKHTVAYPDTLVGTDSHTTMVNGLAVLGWGVGGIEAEACMLGQPLSMLLPQVVGFKLTGALKEGRTATDLVLTVTQMLRKLGVVNKFVEFFGPGIDALSLADRATISNMAPEYGATCGFFPVDGETLNYLDASNRAPERIALVKAYSEAQGLFRLPESPEPVFTETLELDLGDVVPSLAGPKRPQDRVTLESAKNGFHVSLEKEFKKPGKSAERFPVVDANFDLGHGDVVIAAITSCTNTSNPNVMMGAGLLARKAVAKGLKTKPWVKTSLSPGSQVVGEYLEKSGLQGDLDALGFNLTGYGCMTCIGNSGPLPAAISTAINDHDIVAAAVISGNRNFEGRVNPDVKANYLASPPLVVAYALAGSLNVDLATEPLGQGSDGKDVYLRDIWPSKQEVEDLHRKSVTKEIFHNRYGNVFQGDQHWQQVEVAEGETYRWMPGSTYVQNPPYFEGLTKAPAPVADIEGARILALLGDSITTDHISPAGSIKAASPAGSYLLEHQVRPADFNQYGTRRGNHQVMMRGTFANIRIKNQMVPGVEGGLTKHFPSGEQMPIYDAAMLYKQEAVPLVIFAGKEYGTGSSRDWAAKGTKLLGVRAVITESFERIHRSNLVGMGVLPLTFKDGMTWAKLDLKGGETVSIAGLSSGLKPRMEMEAIITHGDGRQDRVPLICRIDTMDELEYFNNGGILPYVLRNLAA